MRKTLFNANFDESRRLRHDALIEYMVRDTNSRALYTEYFSVARKIFSILGVLIMFGIAIFTDANVRHPASDAPMETWRINFLPLWMFFLCWILWLISCRVNLYKKYCAQIPYIGILNANLYMVWMIVSINLFFITFFGKFMTVYGLIIFYLLIILIELWLTKKRLASLKYRLYKSATNDSLEKQRKVIQLFILLIGLVVAGWLTLKILLPGIGEVKTDVSGVLLSIGLIFIVNIFLIGMLIILLLPHSLYGYYRRKYSEEYRQFEEKTLEEWYGKKYLKKYGGNLYV